MEPDEKKPESKYGKKQTYHRRFLSKTMLFFSLHFKAGEDLETMTAGGWEGVDITALLQIRSHHHSSRHGYRNKQFRVWWMQIGSSNQIMSCVFLSECGRLA